MSLDQFSEAELRRAETALATLLDDEPWPDDPATEIRFDWLFVADRLRSLDVPLMLSRALEVRLAQGNAGYFEEEVIPAGSCLESQDSQWTLPVFRSEPEYNRHFVTTRARWRDYLARAGGDETTQHLNRTLALLDRLRDMAALSADGGQVTEDAIRSVLRELVLFCDGCMPSVLHEKRSRKSQDAGDAEQSDGVVPKGTSGFADPSRPEVEAPRSPLDVATDLLEQLMVCVCDTAGWTPPEDIQPADRSIHADSEGNIYHRITFDVRQFAPSVEQLWTNRTWPALRDFLNGPLHEAVQDCLTSARAPTGASMHVEKELALQLPESRPLPESIRTILDPTIRQRATDAWRAASRLRRLMELWECWFHRLRTAGDADPGLALRMQEAVAACVRALCSLDVNMRTFYFTSPEELLSRFPSPPWPSLDPPWQQDQAFRQRTWALLHWEGWNPLLAELLGFMHLLETAPSVNRNRQDRRGDVEQGGTGAESIEENEPESGSETQTSNPELNEREREILRALLLLGADGERRRVSRTKAARKADASCKPSSYNKAIASLVKRGYVASQTGPGGGIWLSSEGASLAKTLSSSQS